MVPGTQFTYVQEYYKRNSPFYEAGVGWSLKTDKIIREHYTDPYYPDSATFPPNFTLQLADGRSFELEFSDSTDAVSLKDYKLEDLKVSIVKYAEHMDWRAVFKLEKPGGIVEYFDDECNLIEIVNKYGNRIRFEYKGVEHYFGQTYIVSIIDSNGGVTKITSTDSSIIFVMPDQSKVTYYYTMIEGAPYLTSKKDDLGNETIYEYTKQFAKYDGWSRIWPGYPVDVSYMNLTKITHPTGATTTYDYKKMTGYSGINVEFDYYRLGTRYDKIKGSNVEYNKETYTYSPTGYTGTLGHQTGSLPDYYTYYTQIEYA